MIRRWKEVAVLALAVGGAAPAQVTQKVSVSTAGAQGNPGSTSPWISADGRFVAFHSAATNLVAGDTNAVHDSFLRDRLLGTTERVSVNTAGTQGNAASQYPSASADGRYVAFYGPSSNLVGGDSNGTDDVFVRDRQIGTTERVSVSTGGVQANDHSRRAPSISADGRFVAFESRASNLVAGDTNGSLDIFLRDRQLGTTERLSVDTGEVQGNADSSFPCISADGRFVAFQSLASNLVAGDTNMWDVFVRDLQLGTTERVSVGPGGAQGNSSSFEPAISADGRIVAFRSDAANLVLNDTNGVQDVFVHDRQTGTTVLASAATDGTQAGALSQNPSISDDGRFAGFESSASNLVAGDTNLLADSFVHDLLSGTTERASLTHAGAQGNASSWFASLSGDGRFVAFYSLASNLVPGDTGGADVFVRDRTGGTSFTSLCDPGLGGVIPCPCSNPPGGPGRGCNNSSGTGGAVLAATGGAYLSSDSLVFTTSGERPTSLSIMAQWNGFNPTGVIFGQGVRCTSGTFKRLYAKSASGGSITAPDYGAGELSVSARSASIGDLIQAGQSRWYFVFYRDPNVLGGCPPAGTFNATQTGQVTWAP